MPKRINFSSNTKWENMVGFSRAVKVGNLIEVSGTASADEDIIIGEGNIYEQTKFIIQKIEKTLTLAGADLSKVIRTRIFTTDISQWEKISNAHNEYFKDIRPACTMVEVSAFINSRLLVEIEATAILI
jgi:enamine deaminase RidA (YjgF/YER057c/UK114 family)